MNTKACNFSFNSDNGILTIDNSEVSLKTKKVEQFQIVSEIIAFEDDLQHFLDSNDDMYTQVYFWEIKEYLCIIFDNADIKIYYRKYKSDSKDFTIKTICNYELCKDIISNIIKYAKLNCECISSENIRQYKSKHFRKLDKSIF